MSPRLLAVAFLLLALTSAPAGQWRGPTAVAQTDQAKVTLVPSSNSTAIGGSVSFSGTVSGVNSTFVTYIVIGPDGTSDNGTVPISGSSYSFSWTFNVSGDWAVFSMAGDLNDPQAISDPVTISVQEVPATYLGVPVLWLGVAILVITAASLVYLVYAIKGREAAEAEAAKRKEGEGNDRAPAASKP